MIFLKPLLTYSMFVFISVSVVMPASTYGASEELIMGIFPRRNAKVTVKFFKPLATYLSGKLGKKVRVVTAKNFPEFWKGVKKGRYDIVHYNQLHYIESHNLSGYEVIAQNQEFGSNTIAGGFAVRIDSGIDSVKDLKGKKIIFGGGKKAMIAYVVNTVTLRNSGISANDYTEVFAKNPPNSTITTFHKLADAAGIGDVGLKIPILKKKGVDVSKMKLIGTSDKLPHLPWAVKGSMDEKVKKAVQEALIKLNDTDEGKLILKKAKLSGMSKASDSDYNVHREIINEYKTKK